jgi:hypothetical protein
MSGTAIPEVSAMLGHANVNITLTVYTHFIPKMQTDSAARLSSSDFRRRSSWSVTFKNGLYYLESYRAWTLQTFTKHGVPQDFPSCVRF